MNSESIDAVKTHCQAILAIVCRLEPADDEPSLDETKILKELASCVTSADSLGRTIQLAIDQLCGTKSCEDQSKDQNSMTTEAENLDLSSQCESTEDEKLCSELIAKTFDGVMTFENLLKFLQDKRTTTSSVNSERDLHDDKPAVDSSSCADTNQSNELQEEDGSANTMKDSSSNSIEPEIIDLSSDTIEIDSEDETMTEDDSISTEVEEIVTLDDDSSKPEEEEATVEPTVEPTAEQTAEPTRKRKLETNSDADCEHEEVLPKHSCQANAHANIPTAAVATQNVEQSQNTSLDAMNINENGQPTHRFEQIATQSGIKDSVEYENVEYLDDPNWVIILESDEDNTDSPIPYIRNTNREMHFQSSSYRTACLLCGKNDPFMVNHYMQDHPEHEVLISRMSPAMTERLRLQNGEFKMIGKGEIKGICYFCEEIMAMKRSCWERHILTHTGELPFACEGCFKGFAKETDHDNRTCIHRPINIFLPNSSDGSSSGYCCKECNYLQIERNRMIAHLINEHGFECPMEKFHYEKVALVPATTRNNVQSAPTDSSLVSTQDANRTNGKSVTFIVPVKENVEDETSLCPNTDLNVHYGNQSTCLLCGVADPSLAYHYSTCHPNAEVYVSRPSPQMAIKLRQQVAEFTASKDGKIVGLCYFCGDSKILNKLSWRQHILKHTGEKIFSCNRCAKEVNYKKQHDDGKCSGKLYDICEYNSLDGSYVGFICSECNYVQIRFDRMIKHLGNQHGHDVLYEDQHYQRCTLLPSEIKPTNGNQS